MDTGLLAVISVLLVVLSAIFVAAEYGLVGLRKSRIEVLAGKGNRAASLVLKALDQVPKYIATIQVGITIIGLALGSLTEPLVAENLERLMGSTVHPTLSFFISLVLVTFVMVVLGELVPKYLALHHPERIILILIRPLNFFVFLLAPVASVAQLSGKALLKPLGIDISSAKEGTISRDELTLMVRAGESGGTLEEDHANVVTKALRFDKLDAADIMIHRLDVHWVDAELSFDDLVKECSKIPHSRIPVCRGDIDDVVGILYTKDLLANVGRPNFELERILKPAEIVPENLTLTKIVNRMRDARTQILIVVDEFGGTSGLVTLEDVVEEVFGEMEDQIETERPQIDRMSNTRLSVKSSVRFDELMEYLELPTSEETSTETLATLIVEELERTPKLGDKVDTEVGTIVVENMARQRITRVRVLLNEALMPQNSD